MNGAERTRRAEELALAAADAPVFDDTRDACATRVAGIFADHRNSTCRTMCGAVAAAHAVCIDNAEVIIDDSVADMDHSLLLRSDWKDGSCRAYLRAGGAFRTAEAAVEVHLRLHQMSEVSARVKHIVRAVGDA